MQKLFTQMTQVLRKIFSNAGRANGCARFQLQLKDAGLFPPTGRIVDHGKCQPSVFRIYGAMDGAPFSLRRPAGTPVIRIVSLCLLGGLVILISGCSSTRSMRVEAEQRILRKLKVCVGHAPEKCGCIGTKGACREHSPKANPPEPPAEDPDPAAIDPSQCEVVEEAPSVANLPNPESVVPIRSGESWQARITSELKIEAPFSTQCVYASVNGATACQCHTRFFKSDPVPWLQESLRAGPLSLITVRDAPVSGMSRPLGEFHASEQ